MIRRHIPCITQQPQCEGQDLMTLKTLIDTIDRQEKIIDLQKDVINDLFQLLSMHISADELDSLDAVKKINFVAQLRED